MSSDPALLPDSMRAPGLTQFAAPTAALATVRLRLPTAAQGEPLGPSSSVDPFTPQELAAWRGLLELHAQVIRQLDVQLHALHGLTLSQCEVLILLDDAPGERMRMTELAAGVLLSRSACTRLVDRLETLGYVTRRAATDDRRGLYAKLTDTGRHVITPARATHREGVRAAFLDRLRTTDQVALDDIWARVRGALPSSDPTGRTVSQTARKP
ncbi:MAG TPA: MarR family transcriptional regulator [Thermoleophilaceae bacterium]